MLGTIKRDLLLRGLDPNNVELDENGMFVEKTKPEVKTTKKKVLKNAIVQPSESTPENMDKNIKSEKQSKSE